MHRSIPDFFFQGVAAGRRTKGDLSFGRLESAIALLMWILIIFPRAQQTESPRQAFRSSMWNNVHRTHALGRLTHAHSCCSKYALHICNMLYPTHAHACTLFGSSWKPIPTSLHWEMVRIQSAGEWGQRRQRNTALVVNQVNRQGDDKELKVTLCIHCCEFVCLCAGEGGHLNYSYSSSYIS